MPRKKIVIEEVIVVEPAKTRKVKPRKAPSEKQRAARAEFGRISKLATAYRAEHPGLSRKECFDKVSK